MATVTLRRSDLFPVGTTVGIYPAASHRTGQVPPGPPTSAAIASAAVDAAGLLTVTDAGISSLTQYVAAASVGGEWRFAFVRSTLDLHDAADTAGVVRSGNATGTGDTTSGSASVANVSTTTGAFVNGQSITGPGIPAGTTILSGGGTATLTLSAAATASAPGVGLIAYGGRTWRARARARRAALGTS